LRGGLMTWLYASLILLAVMLALGLAACKTESLNVVLVGSGSTFVQPAMISWIKGFEEEHGVVEVEYLGGGSGKGLQDLLSGKVDFACSDPPLSRGVLERYRGELIQFPVVLGAVVVTYNLPEIRGVSLNLSGRILAGIYMGYITYWDNPEIKRLNPAIASRLPHRPIIAVHRSDASGTTELFTLFLYKSSGGLWPRALVGKVVEWPVDSMGRGVGEQGNPGVASAIESTPYSIGYLEWSYAVEKRLPIARIMNPAGVPVYPSVETIMAAFSGRDAPSPAGDWTSYVYESIYSNSSVNAYPIVGQTFMVTWVSQASQAKCRALKEFIVYIATKGQEIIPSGYAQLPSELRERVLEAASMIKCPGG
jgi:phosphate transport system substrate-binding protein